MRATLKLDIREATIHPAEVLQLQPQAATLMKQLLKTSLSVLGALALLPQANAISLTLTPSSQFISVGGLASVDVVISGLGDLASPSLGAFDLSLAYDPAILSTPTIVFGSQLDLGIVGSAQFVVTGGGAISLSEVSFESPGDLNSAQPGSFTLATLTFTGLAPGSTGVPFTYVDLSDELGNTMQPSGWSDCSITVEAPSIPDASATWSLLLMGILGLPAIRKSRVCAT